MDFSSLLDGFGGGGGGGGGNTGGGGSGQASGKGSSYSAATVGNDTITKGLDNHTVVLLAAVAGAVVLVIGLFAVVVFRK